MLYSSLGPRDPNWRGVYGGRQPGYACAECGRKTWTYARSRETDEDRVCTDCLEGLIELSQKPPEVPNG